MSDEQEKQRRHRSPAYPAINLEEAINRARQFWDREKRYFALPDVALSHWDYTKGSSTGMRVVAALIHFGLMEGEGSGKDRKIKLTDRAITILLDSREDRRAKALKEAALEPNIYKELWEKFDGGLPSDESLRSFLLVEKEFNDKVIDYFIDEFKASLRFAQLIEGDTVEREAEVSQIETGEKGQEDASYVPQIGDRVQWESQGQLQFSEDEGRQVVGFSEDREWVFVKGTSTGIPMGEIALIAKGSETTQRKPPPENPFLKEQEEGSGMFHLTVPFKGTDLTVEVRSKGQKLSKEHVQRVRAYLKLAEDDLEAGEWDSLKVRKQTANQTTDRISLLDP